MPAVIALNVVLRTIKLRDPRVALEGEGGGGYIGNVG